MSMYGTLSSFRRLKNLLNDDVLKGRNEHSIVPWGMQPRRLSLAPRHYITMTSDVTLWWRHAASAVHLSPGGASAGNLIAPARNVT